MKMNYDFRSEPMTKIQKTDNHKIFQENFFTIFSSLAGGFLRKTIRGA
jgi:hypothetical protein